MKTQLEYDALIIGTGVAGLSCAIKLAESGLSVGLLTRETDPNKSNTFWAQGGIILPEDNDSTLESDINSASSKTSSKKAIDVLLNRSRAIVEEILLDKTKANFNKDSNGNLLFTKEGAHSVERILYQGDFTGKEIQISLLNYLKDKNRFPNVTIMTSCTAIDLLTPLHHGVDFDQRYEDHQIVGAYVYDQINQRVIKVVSKKTILATGGIGALYLHHTNSEGARGDGHAMARRAGAIMANMEFVQFHPTTFYDRSSHRRFLISEAVRGEGGVLLNSHGEPFMEKYHPDKELAPRDVVARAIQSEMIETKNDCVYLDISFKDPSWLQERFPTIYEHCLSYGVDITRSPIPVVPAAHYSCGGVKTNQKGQTTLKNLYAVGEVACTGLHGANRLASTSLLEGLTWGYLAAESIVKNIETSTLYPSETLKEWETANEECDMALITQDWLTLKQTLWNYVGLTRSDNRLKRARMMFFELSEEIHRFYRDTKLNDELIGLRNAVEVAQEVVKASMRNKQSIGCFYLK